MEASRLSDLAIEKWDKGEYPPTEQLFSRALEIWKTVLGTNSEHVATGLYNLANLYYVQGRYDEAVQLYKRSLSVAKKHPEPSLLVNILHWLAETYFANREYNKAHQIYKKVIAITEEVSGSNSPELATAIMDLGFSYYYVGKYNKSEPYYLHALSIRETAIGIDSIEVADTCQSLAILYDNAEGLNTDAEPYYRRTLSIYENTYGNAHKITAEAAYRLADHLAHRGKFDEADIFYNKWISIIEHIPNIAADEIGWMISGYEKYLKKIGREKEAEALVNQWQQPDAYESLIMNEYEKRKSTLGPDHPLTLETLSSIANSFIFNENYAQAEEIHREVLQKREKVLGPNHPDTAQSLYQLSKIARYKDQLKDAEAYICRAINIQVEIEGKNNLEYALYMEQLAYIFDAQEKTEQAESLYKEILSTIDVVSGHESRDMAESLWHLGRFYASHRKFSEAESTLREAIDITEKNIGVSQLEKTDYLEDYAYVLDKLEKTELAEAARQQAEAIHKDYEREREEEEQDW